MRTIADAIAHIHAHAGRMADVVDRLEQLLGTGPEPADFRTIAINDGNNGQYVVTDRAQDWVAQSYGIINPGTVNVFAGFGGHSANPTSRSLQVPANGAIVLPVRVVDIELGCDPTLLQTNTAVIYVLRFRAVQPFFLRTWGT